MAIRYEIRQGDWGRTITVQAQNADGSPIPAIPGGSTVAWTMVHATSGHRVAGAGTITGTNNDTLNYTFASGDTAKPGCYQGIFTVTYPGGEIETFPTCSDAIDGITIDVCPAL
jgi:hypothetical protein